MNWHNINKLMFRRIILALSILMWIILINNVNLMDAIVVARYGEIKAFTKEWFLADIENTFEYLFAKLYWIVFGLLALSWKGFGENNKFGVWLYNGAIGGFFAIQISYIFTSLFAIRVFSWYTILCGIVAILLLIYLIKNIIYYGKHKKYFKDEKKQKMAGICLSLAATLAIVFAVNFSNEYKSIWDEKYSVICSKVENDADCLADDEITYKDYIKLQYANYFNPEGKTFTIEEFKEAVNNYNSGHGSWYALWYVWDSRGSEHFYDYDTDDRSWYAYEKYVVRELMAKGMEPELATYEELFEACKYVYDVYVSQADITCLGDEKGEVVIHFEIPENKKTDDLVLTYEGEGYFAVIEEWYKVESKDEMTGKRDDPAEVFEEGCMYQASIRIYPRIGYSFARDGEPRYLEYDGAKSIFDGVTSKGPEDAYDCVYIVIGH